jgi:Sigma-54 interaction domain
MSKLIAIIDDEMADNDTLFLDEVGDFHPTLQPKLLPVLQEQEFERLDRGRTHKVYVPLVAATNRDVVKMVARGQFRSDLYYRLNALLIFLPALGDRREDIPVLVTHFVKLFSRRMGKQADSIPPEIMVAFQWYCWPGNIRELQYLLERAVILSRDGVLSNPLHKKQTELMIPSLHHTRTFHPSMTLEDSDRTLILETLEQAGWIVGLSERHHHAYIPSSQAISVCPRPISWERSCVGAVGNAGDRWGDHPRRVRQQQYGRHQHSSELVHNLGRNQSLCRNRQRKPQRRRGDLHWAQFAARSQVLQR